MYGFDIVKLKNLDIIDVKNAVKQFVSYQAYFNALNEFIYASDDFLTGHTPFKILYDEKVRKAFLSEIKDIKKTVVSLGLLDLTSTLTELDYEAYNGSMGSLTGWLTKFREELAHMVGYINTARIIHRPVPQVDEKPIILAVDDKPELLTAIISVLEDKYRVMAVTDGKNALKVIEKHSPELFLLDIEMPGMDGYELAELIRMDTKYIKTPILFLTGVNTRESVMTAITNGGNDYLLKPVDSNLLINKLSQYMRK